MATIAQTGFVAPKPSFSFDPIHRLYAWYQSHQTRVALSKLSPRELNDIGLMPGDVDEIVKAVARS